MKVNRRAGPDRIQEFESLFKKTCDAVKESLGEKPFHIHTGLNAAVYDSIFTVFANHLATFATDYSTDRARNKLRERFEGLTKTPAYIKLTSTGTTDEDIIPKRIKKAEETLFG
jgi:hypothetical protein